MPSAPPAWTNTALKVLLPLTAVFGVAQYVLGLLTNAYAPSSGFTSNTSFNYLDAHYNVGFTLGALSILLVIVAGFTRQPRTIALSVVGFLGILVAGLAGMAFVNTQPNPPNASVLMGVGFLVAFWALSMLGMSLMLAGRADAGSPPAPAGAPSAPSS